MTSTFDAEFTQEAGDSIFVSGNRFANDTYTVIAVPDTGTITALKLEVLSDSRLPNRGPGRDRSGNFALGEIVLEVRPEGVEAAHRVTVNQAWASYAWKNRPVRHAIDGDSGTAWHVWDGLGKPHTAVFLLARPVIVEPGTLLTVRLEHGGDTRAGIGKFRQSVTSDAPPSD
jgi:hypothetical protein